MSPDDLQTLVLAIERKDLCTAAHTWRVTLYARSMAEHAGLSDDLTRRIVHAAALHDVGKLDTPEAILQKPGPLTVEESAVMRGHAADGYERLTRMGEGDDLILGLVRHHHEREDGGGYPDGLAGEEIPMGARHFAVIDAFDAMTSIRPYRASIGAGAVDDALAELEAGIGARYCEKSVRMFVGLYRTGKLGWIHRYFNDACPLPAYCGGEASAGVVEAARASG